MIASGTTNGKAANVATTAIKLWRLKLRYFAQALRVRLVACRRSATDFVARAIGI